MFGNSSQNNRTAKAESRIFFILQKQKDNVNNKKIERKNNKINFFTSVLIKMLGKAMRRGVSDKLLTFWLRDSIQEYNLHSNIDFRIL